MQDTTTPQTNLSLLLLLLLGSLTAFGPLSIDMYLPAFPQIADQLQISMSQVQMSLAVFFVGLAAGQLVYGPLADRYGRKKPLYFGLALYALASLGCALSHSIESLIFFRLLQALGSCAGVVISRAIVRDLFQPQHAARVFALLMLVMGIAPLVAPLLGAFIAENFGWAAIFWVHLAFSSACLLWIFLLLPETHAPNPTVKLRNSFRIYWGITKDRDFMRYALAGGFAQAGLFAYITGSPFVLINLFGIPPEHFGWVFGANAFGLIAAAQVSNYLLRKYQSKHILESALMALAFFGSVLLVEGILGAPMWFVLVPMFLFMACLGMIFPNATAMALAHQGRMGASASGLLGTMQYTLSALVSAGVSRLHNGTMLPMLSAMGLCGLMAFVIISWKRNKIPAHSL
ncbi:Bicyclomycin resistance protein [compost metagenome]